MRRLPLLAVAAFVSAACADAQQPRNLLQNPGFEQPWNSGWLLDPSTYAKGLVYRSEAMVHSGTGSLRLLPNRRNTDGPTDPNFGVVQTLPVEPFLGKPLYVSGWLHAKAGATAVLRLIALSSDGNLTFRELKQETGPAEMVFKRDILDVPNDPKLIRIFVTCTVRGTFGLATFDDIVVSSDPAVTNWTMGQPDPGPPLSASVIVQADAPIRRIPQTLYGMNLEWVQNGQGIWDPDRDGFDPGVLDLAQQLRASLYRFPGGLFADYYHWKDGVGPRADRPTVRPGPVSYLSPQSFGTDEALNLAARTGGNLLITVNPLTGTPEEAADWVRYVNSAGARAKYWEVGNELYLEFPADASGPYVAGAPTLRITPHEYAARFKQFAAAMKAADPGILIGADIEYNYAVSAFRLYPDWAEVVLKEAGDQIDYLSVHNGLAPGLTMDAGWDLRTVYSAMLATPLLIKKRLQELSSLIDATAGAHAPKIRIGVTEWGPLFETNLANRFVDHVKTLGSALFVASAMKVLIEDPRTDVACAFKMIDGSTQGWIGLRDGRFVSKAPYYALQLFTNHFGPILVNNLTTSPSYSTRTIGWAEAVERAPYLEAVSSVDEGRNAVYLILINKHFDRAIQTDIWLSGFQGYGRARTWTVSGTAIDANTGTVAPDTAAQAEDVNGRFNNGGPGEITVISGELNVDGSSLRFEAPPHSVTAIEIPGYSVPSQ